MIYYSINPSVMKKEPYNLSHTNLEVYAALYSLTRRGPYEKTIAGLADMLVIPKASCWRALNYLVERNLLKMDVIVKTKGHKNDYYQFDALVLPDTPLPTRYYKEEIKKYDKQNKDLERKIDNYKREKYIESLREDVQCASQNETIPSQNETILKEKNQKKNNILTLKKEEGKKDEQVVSSSSKEINEEEEKESFPPTWEMVINYAIAKQPGISVETVQEWFAHRELHEWKMGKGGKIKKWRADLFLWDRRAKHFAKKDAGGSDHTGIYACRGTRLQAGKKYKYNTRRAEEPSLLHCITEQAERRKGREAEGYRRETMEQKIQRDAEAQRQELLRREEEGYYK